MDRATALSYLSNEFSEQLSDTGMVATDTSNGFGPVIDNSLRECGYSRIQWPTADVPDISEGRYVAFLEFYALRRFSKLLAQNINIGTNGTNVSLKGAFDNVKSLLDAATAHVKLYGFGGTSGWLRINLDFIENEDGEF